MNTEKQLKQYSPASEKNREPILAVLKKLIPQSKSRLLEIGSGTGQHAVYFAPHFPQLEWTTSDLRENHAGIAAWMKEANLPNIAGPLEVEIGKSEIPPNQFHFIYLANVLHIISEEKVRQLFEMFDNCLSMDDEVLIYGPFNYNGKFTSDGNASFDSYLRSNDPASGVRNFEDICRWMEVEGFELVEDFAMPANNRLLQFKKTH